MASETRLRSSDSCQSQKEGVQLNLSSAPLSQRFRVAAHSPLSHVGGHDSRLTTHEREQPRQATKSRLERRPPALACHPDCRDWAGSQKRGTLGPSALPHNRRALGGAACMEG